MKSDHDHLPDRLLGPADIPAPIRDLLQQDLARSLIDRWPDDLNAYIRDIYQADISGRYAGRPIKNPFGKASGQLTMNTGQIQDAAEAGLGFVVLKTVIAQNQLGDQSMAAWAVPEARMVVEPITGNSGRTGWTVTWKGRGWSRPFSEYLQLCRDAFQISNKSGMVVAPSVKFHLPGNTTEAWRVDEYQYTLHELTAAWRETDETSATMPLEKDFSPTLAGDDRGRQKELILRWLAEVVPLIRNANAETKTIIGLKLMNYIGDEEFQESMLNYCLTADSRADFLVYANRLFDPNRIFQGQQGVAFGGPDLSDRNLRVLQKCRNLIHQQNMEISGTGDIDSGRTAVEYGLRGCRSVQMHTLFQVPSQGPAGSRVSRTRQRLARLIFDPDDGLVAWLWHARLHWGLVDDRGTSRWLDLPKCLRQREIKSF